MVRKSLRRALALGTSRAARDGAAIWEACLEPAHSANAGSGKRLFWHFPLLGWHAAPLGASPGWWLQVHGAHVGTDPPWGAYPGTALERGAGMGQVRQGPVFQAAWMLGSPSALALCQSCSGAVGTGPLQSPGKGRASAAFVLPRVGIQGFRETPGAGQGSFPFSVKFCMWGGERLEQSAPSPWEWLQGSPLPSHTGAALQTEVPSPGVAEAGGIASPVVRSH